MAKRAASGVRVYFDEFNLSGVLSSAGLAMNPELAKVAAFSDAGPRRVLGNYDAEQSHLGYFEPTDEGYDEQIFDALTAAGDHFLTQLFGGVAIGDVAYDHVMQVTGQPRSAQLAGAILLNFDGAGANGTVRGVVLGNKTSTGAESLAGVNQGVTVAGQITAVIFRLIAFTGTDITLKLQGSSNDGGGDPYADIAGLTSGALTAIDVVRATTTAALEAWKRLDISGTFSSAEILVTAGVVAGSS